MLWAVCCHVWELRKVAAMLLLPLVVNVRQCRNLSCVSVSVTAARWWRNMRLMEKMRVYPNHSELSFLSLSEGAEPSQERQLVSTHRPHLFQLSGCHAMNQTEIPALLYKLLLHPNTVVL